MTIIIFLAVLLLLVIVHEFGHFSIAKLFGVRVDEFGVGFPPKILGIKKGETEYTINALPFGGFVRIFGENPDQESLAGSDKERALVNKPRLIQAAVLFAGVFFNIVLAWIFFSGTLMAGAPAIAGQYDQYLSNERLYVSAVLPDAPAAKAGIMPGDEIAAIGSSGGRITPTSAEDTIQFIGEHINEPLLFEIKRGEDVQSLSITPEVGVLQEDPHAPAIGVAMAMVGELRLPPYLALWEGLKKTGVPLAAITAGIATFLFDALLFQANFSDVAGPIGIVGLVGDASAMGLLALINFTAFISLNLAVINLIPFPALDGGRLLFLAIEAVKGSRISPRIANATNAVGFALLILLMLVVTYNDILRLTN